MVTLSFTIFSGQKNYNRAHMLFQVLCGFEPIFYTTHPNEESLIFKYLRLISLSKENEELEKYYKKRMESCLIYYGKTEKIICDFAEM